MKTVEAIARAVCARHHQNDEFGPDDPYTAGPEADGRPAWMHWIPEAVVVIRTLAATPPNQGMIDAGVMAVRLDAANPNTVAVLFNAMLKEALAQAESNAS